jgi:hypothetical protein
MVHQIKLRRYIGLDLGVKLLFVAIAYTVSSCSTDFSKDLDVKLMSLKSIIDYKCNPSRLDSIIYKRSRVYLRTQDKSVRVLDCW